MTMSPFPRVKGDDFTGLTPVAIIRCLEVQHQSLHLAGLLLQRQRQRPPPHDDDNDLLIPEWE